MSLFDEAIKKNIAYVPGSVFYKGNIQTSYARLNFTNATLEEINEGMKRLKEAYISYTAIHE